MEKATPTIKVDTAENWKKAVNYIPDIFTIIIVTEDGKAPVVKMGDGKTKVNDLKPLNSEKEVVDSVLIL